MVSLAECDTRAAAGNEAGVDGVEALEEASGPFGFTSRLSELLAVFSIVVDLLHPLEIAR